MTTLIRYLKGNKRLPGKYETLLAFTPITVFLAPIIVAFFDEKLFELPRLILIPICILYSLLFITGLHVLIRQLFTAPFSIVDFLMSRFEKGRERLKSFKRKREKVKFDSSRRRFISASAAAVSGYVFVSAGAGVVGKDDYEIVRKTITIKNLPENLKGTTISLVSDIHSGPYMKLDTMRDYCSVINSLKSDIILIPGDMTSSEKVEIAPFVNAFRDLRAEHGVYATLGNHDYLSQPDYIADAISADTPIRMLRNDALVINKNGEKFCLLGMEDTKESMVEDWDVLNGYLDKTIDKARYHFDSYSTMPKVLLCHKPYFFRDMSQKGIDLILSGHTHGGQVVLAKFGSLNISMASTVSEYVSGLYSANGSQMYVSRGIGSSSIPLRLNCPPEITQITLV
ncbi:MAG: metallophosphoesterase [Ignavibacteriae bacterium]|nr:metallophosphoesterase [Ignavibacteriota bacterium]MCB9244087.1 metallophosphoesterase [Ignavibacteriales bacterium]